ncbi:zinc protease [Catellatospora sp. TT07R-123]|nr:zinc protease [Catellatospora sp. TT07R-123]
MAASPLVGLNLRLEVGSRHEQVGQHGYAHLFEHLMFSGTRSVPNGAHMAAIQTVGGNVNASTSTDSTNFNHVVGHEDYTAVLALEAERLKHLADALDDAGVGREIEVVSNERFEQEGRPFGDVNELVASLLYPAPHPYAHLPLAPLGDVRAASRDSVVAFFTTHYVPSRAAIAIVGSVDPEAALGAVDHYLSGFSPGPDPCGQEHVEETPSPGGDTPVRAERSGVWGPRLFIGLSIPPAGTLGHERTKLLAQLLAGGHDGLLIGALGRDRKLVSDVNIRFMSQARHAALCVVELVALPGADLADLESAYAEAVASIDLTRLRPQALERLLGLYRSAWLCNRDRVGGHANDLSFAVLFQDGPWAPDTMYDAMLRTTLADLTEALGCFRLGGDCAVVRYRHADR